MKSSALDVVEVPPGVVTVTSTVPALPTGEVAVICVALFTVKLAAGVPPKDTAVAPVKSGTDDVMVTLVPPPMAPEFGLRPVTTGTASGAPVSSSRLALDAWPSVKRSAPLPALRTEVGPLSVVKRFDGPPATV